MTGRDAPTASGGGPPGPPPPAPPGPGPARLPRPLPRPWWQVRLLQLLVVVVAVVVAGSMVRLGYWQLDTYRQQATGFAVQRAAEPAQELQQVAPAGQLSEDGYGRTVTFAGHFEAERQFLIPVPERPGSYRVLTSLQQSDGSRVPVVRGEARLPGEDPVAPVPPAGEQQLQGILLPSELRGEDADQVPADQLASIRLPQVAQQWPAPLVNGFVTLDADDAAASGLALAAVVLPEGEGELRNGGYAIQWWVFAVFGLIMAGVLVRDIDRKAVAQRSGQPTP